MTDPSVRWPTRCTTTSSRVHWSAAAGVPVTYVLNDRDRPIRPDTQEIMVRGCAPPVEVIRLDSGHLLPVTSPAVLAKIVNRVAA